MRRLVTIVTSAYSSYSSCRQYREDLAGAVAQAGEEGLEVSVDKIRPYFNHPGFSRSSARLVTDAVRDLVRSGVDAAGLRLVFVTHSIPTAMDETSGPGDTEGHLYSRQHRALSAAITEEVNATLDLDLEGELVFCSRSGPPTQPWLEPDVNDRLEELATGARPPSCSRRSGSSPTTWRSSTTSTPRRPRRPSGSGCAWSAFPPSARTASSSPGWSTCSWSGLVRPGRAAVPAGLARHGRPPVGVPPRLLPQPARGQAGPVRTGLTMATVPDSLPLAELESLAVEVAAEAARLIVDERPEELGVERTKSSATDVVTVMDQRAQDLIRGRLRAARPSDGFLGEEEGGSATSSEVTWVVDPIDGTVNYLYGIPAYAVSVAAVVGDPAVPGEWTPVAGAVVDPERGRTFRARLGGGAWMSVAGAEDVRLGVGRQSDLAQALVGTGFGYESGVRRWQAQVLADVIPHVRDIRRFGSAALDLCHVADGSLDAYFERGSTRGTWRQQRWWSPKRAVSSAGSAPSLPAGRWCWRPRRPARCTVQPGG